MKGNWVLIVLVGLFTSLVTYRAVVIPMTHDEASTWLNFRHYNLWSCISNYYCWQSANNHWLNSLLMQWSATIFGDHPFALRLPNVLAGVLYFLAAGLIVSRYLHAVWLQLSGFLLLSANIYLLDFFSLCRGYGLVSCGMIWGVYAIMRYSELFQFRWLMVCVSVLFLAVLSNFTAILPFLSMGLLWFVLLVFQQRYSLLLKHGSVWLLSTVLLVMLLAYPFSIFRSEGELAWGSNNLWGLSNDLAGNLLYGFQNGFDNGSSLLVYTMVLVLCVVGMFVLFAKKLDARTPLLLSFGVLLINLGILVIYQEYAGSSLPIGRKSVYLIPVIFTPLSLGLGLVKQKTWGLFLGLGIGGLLLFHSFRPSSWGAVREWYYDAYYPELFSSLLPDQQTDDSIRLGSSWIFFPSLSFYANTGHVPLSGLAYQRPLMVDSTMQYYFVEPVDSVGMYHHGFALEKTIGPFYLFKKQPVTSPTSPNEK